MQWKKSTEFKAFLFVFGVISKMADSVTFVNEYKKNRVEATQRKVTVS